MLSRVFRESPYLSGSVCQTPAYQMPLKEKIDFEGIGTFLNKTALLGKYTVKIRRVLPLVLWLCVHFHNYSDFLYFELIITPMLIIDCA